MTTVAIIGILASLAVAASIYGTGRARLNNATFEITAMASVAQIRAQSHGTPHYLVIYEAGENRGVVLGTRDERTGGLAAMDWSTFDPLDTDTLGGTIVDHLRLASTSFFEGNTVAFAGLTNFDAELPRPFRAISMTPGGTSGLLAACSFCTEGGGGSTVGVIRFNADGSSAMATGADPGGGVVGLESSSSKEARRPRLIAFSAPTGAVKVFTE